MSDKKLTDTILRDMIVTVDGPAGSGKSTTAQALSERLDLTYLDTGAMYRAVTWKVLQSGIDPEDRQRRWIDTESGGVEAWTVRTADRDRSKVDLLAIKFPGTGGRAERGGPHPFELWRDLNVEIWTINHAGYGGSTRSVTCA